MSNSNDLFNQQLLLANNEYAREGEQLDNTQYCFQKESDFLRLFSNGDMRSLDVFKSEREKFVQTLATSKNRSYKNNLIVFVTHLTRAAIDAGCNPNEMTNLMSNIIKEVENYSVSLDKEIIFEVETKILLVFIRKIKQNRVKGLSKTSQLIIHYIQENLSEPIGLSDLAVHCGRHPNYISALFKRETNKNIHRYILEERIKKAKHFIRHTDYLFVEIAQLCGFESQSYFSVQFKKIVGCTPKTYRNN
ncbi:AraC family transcriptional regulator [Gracilibacillus sp. S3-1-1]|uniref:AraC family transcriptional regulator n=1 Tax=Gracilibacillus pellucidus TaxID=3095368 RepID=A0ACC6M3J4_9BACI|nr:AraC family transcriptional regulator [Gracilibacillus sp. S3-1-1]MDX8045499.1 AraC family transcriptional regulator [Gracilibacillus sp. S3-1-1]